MALNRTALQLVDAVLDPPQRPPAEDSGTNTCGSPELILTEMLPFGSTVTALQV